MPDEREYKTVSAFVTETNTDEDKALGIVDHLISVYGIIDGGQDMAHKGMFTKTIKERANQIKVIDNHNKKSVLDSLGIPLEFYEVARHGLPDNVRKEFPDATGGQCVKTQFLLDTPEGFGAFTRLKAGAISEFSFAYKTMQKDYENIGEIKVRHLREVKLFEYGPVLFPMNEAASMISAKSEEDIPAAFTEAKEAGMSRQISKLREAFYADWKRFEEEVPSDTADGDATVVYKWYNIVDVYEKYLIADCSQSTVYYKVGYETLEDGTYTFSEKSDWVVGMLEFTPTNVEGKEEQVADEEKDTSDSDADREFEAEALAIKEALEAELGLPAGTGPEEKTDPPSSTESVQDWDTEHQDLLDTFNSWRT